MNVCPTLLIGRCSFWPEARDPEAWLRALSALARAAECPGTASWTSPRTVGDTVLRGHLSRRGVPGLFGLDCTSSPALLHGVGMLKWNAATSVWQLSSEAHALSITWQKGDHRQAMEAFAILLLRRSAWLRLTLLKLHSGAWHLVGWDNLKATNGQLYPGKSLLLRDDAEPAGWLTGLEAAVLGAWLSPDLTAAVQVHAPKTAKAEDGLSLSPLKSPLYLLDSLGWLDSEGRLRLPDSITEDLLLGSLQGRERSAVALLNQATATFADHRGAFPLESVMVRFARDLGVFPHAATHDPAFREWTDSLLSESFRLGAIELFSAEPGQARHGRGLFGDPQQKLLRWRVHDGFKQICHSMSSPFPSALATSSL